MQNPREQNPVVQTCKLNVLAGLPDDRRCEVSVRQSGQGFYIEFPGTADITQFLPEVLFDLQTINLGPAREVDLSRLGPGPILNHIAEPDRCSKTLAKAEEIVRRSRRPCFNHPSGVMRTARDGVARLLEDIERLDVPRTIRHRYRGAAGLKKAVDDAKLAYPLLLRVAGDHGGISMVRAAHEGELAKAERINCYDREIYATEFRDYKSADGRYRKYRIAVVGPQFFLRHLIIGDDWLLHAERRGEGTQDEEQRVLESFDETLAPKIRPAIGEITRRLGLDYFGIDCNIGPDGEFTLFEANACMNILANSRPSPNMWDRPIARIRAALLDLLQTPQSWRHPARVARIAK